MSWMKAGQTVPVEAESLSHRFLELARTSLLLPISQKYVLDIQRAKLSTILYQKTAIAELTCLVRALYSSL